MAPRIRREAANTHSIVYGQKDLQVPYLPISAPTPSFFLMIKPAVTI